MKSDCDNLPIRRRKVTDDRFHSLGGVWGVLWALGDLWRESGLSGLLLLPSGNSSPLISPLQVAISLCHFPTQSGTTAPKGAVIFDHIFSPSLPHSPYLSRYLSCLSPGPGSIIFCRMREATLPFKFSPSSKPLLLQIPCL